MSYSPLGLFTEAITFQMSPLEGHRQMQMLVDQHALSDDFTR